MPIVFDVIEFVHEHQQQLFVMNHIWLEYLAVEMNVSVDMYLFSMITFDYFNGEREKKLENFNFRKHLCETQILATGNIPGK